MAGKIKGGKVQSIKSLKSQMKKGGGGAGYMSRVPEDGSITARFLTEPDGWVMFYEHFDAVRKFYPCTDDCPGCHEGDRPSQRYLASVVDVDENKVIPLLLPKSAASSVLKKYDKYGTLLDRDYEVSRTGSGMDTEYEAIPESPTKMNLSRFEEIDLWALIEAQLPSEDDDDDDDEDERPRKKRRKGSDEDSAPVRKKKRKRPVEDDDDDDDDDDDEDERPVKKKKSAPAGKKRKPVKRSMNRR